jgi:pimeloyl-ACP methyl ester carboxylesterase
MIESWDTEHLQAAARSWSATATLWEESFCRVRQGALWPGGTIWEGEAADAAAERTFADLVKARGASDRVTKAADIARRGADRLGDLKRSALSAIGDARAAGFTVGEDLSVSDNSVLPVGPALAARRALAEEHAAAIHARAAALSLADHEVAASISAALAPLAEVVFDEAPADAGGSIHALDHKTSPADSGEKPKAPGASEIPPATTPVGEVKRWWESKTPAEKAALIAGHSDAIGNLDGVPSAARDHANRVTMESDLARVDHAAREHHVSLEEVRANPTDYGLMPQNITRFDNATEVQAGLDKNYEATGQPGYLLVYKPEAFDGQGRAAIAINNPDTANKVAVVVPGTSHSVTEGWLSQPDARNVFTEMEAASPEGNSVVAWMGYDAPDSLLDPRIQFTALAHDGAGLLANDVNALQTTHLGQSNFTVIGHSYGSTTVADAAWMGMQTNDVALLGSPGTDLAKTAADFYLPDGGQVYVGSASTDPVTMIGGLAVPLPGTEATLGLGPDPSVDGFGATRFKAEVPGLNILDTLQAKDHSHYLDPGTESARSLGLIATGQGDALQSWGLTAPGRPNFLDHLKDLARPVVRGPLGIFAPDVGMLDPELPRLASDPGTP